MCVFVYASFKLRMELCCWLGSLPNMYLEKHIFPFLLVQFLFLLIQLPSVTPHAHLTLYIEPGNYSSVFLPNDGQLCIPYVADSNGTLIDVLFMTKTDFQLFQEDKKYSYDESCSCIAVTSCNKKCELILGPYGYVQYAVFITTDPKDSAKVTFSYDIQVCNIARRNLLFVVVILVLGVLLALGTCVFVGTLIYYRRKHAVKMKVPPMSDTELHTL